MSSCSAPPAPARCSSFRPRVTDPVNPSIHLVLSCTNRKHAQPGAHPRLRDIGGRDVETRAAAWIETVDAAEPLLPARDLYAGEYWKTARELADECGRHMRTDVWVISA